ncbi:glycoside hydrolase family 99-like domain-containing protein [uncultured Dokdonia sp.]|uniref:glycosyltransferase WbsX family protein n=1 Tax=uncultured Dokdonia sp. TaxID=575653 RepID=UPI0030EE2634|tara:strand:+ start:59012 stop:60103 length:1092 start_codon:yes stop_codon:yes gene_type:complete
MADKIKAIAIHLPQFHPIAENNEWWGNGFTEWTNVSKAKPLFKDHYQPHLPADLGFYDLRLEEARLAQEALAKTKGIHGFCYYHYWFNGKRILEKPVNGKLKNPKEDLPFMLCWANENWTRVWDGGEKNILLNQEYSLEDDKAHIQELINYFKDDRYIKVNGKPMFIVYRPRLFPNLKETVALWREEVKKAGFPDIYLGFARTFEYKDAVSKDGFDFAFTFQPNFETRPDTLKESQVTRYFYELSRRLKLPFKNKYDLVYDYAAYRDLQIQLGFEEDTYPTVTPMWDNTARRRVNYFVLHDSTPEKYKKWLTHVAEKYPWKKMPEPFLFINAWNEWAEGNHLEPCQKWGTQYLDATQEVINKD